MYHSSDLSVYNSIEEIATKEQQPNDALLLVICHSGQLLLETAVTYHLAADDLLLCPAGWNINKFFASHDLQATFYLIRRHALEELTHFIIHTDTNLWNQYRFLREHPVLHLNERQRRIYKLSEELQRLYMSDNQNPYNNHIVRILLQLGVYEMLGWLDTIVQTDKQLSTPARLSRKDQLTGDFMRLVVEQKGMQREVRWYADKLCVTPKYLAACVREKMSRSPHEYINEVLMTEIRQLLQQTDLTAQQIAHRLHFPSQSFFGKYVKTQTGMSPITLRRELRKE